MISEKYQWKITGRVIFLFATLFITAFALVKEWWPWLVLAIPLIIYLVLELYRFQKRAHEELEQFTEAVHYRDFSRHFDVKNAPAELRTLRKSFNDINTTFKTISKEKETQYHYLQKILELVDTGILSYEEKEGEVLWMNESLRQLLRLPYLKNIHSLQKRDETLYDAIIALKPGTSAITTAHIEREAIKILLAATAFQTDGKMYRLVTFQNVSEALDETESKAWQKLLSVMTHEIMNSIAPISSLADTLKHRLTEVSADLKERSASLDDLALGIDTIKKRSEGLLRFAETYRNLNKINTLNLQKLFVRDLFENIYQLMQPTLQQKNMEMETVLKDTGIFLEADPDLLEQVLINLVVNAMEAVKDVAAPRIVLSGYATPANKIVLKVADNGIGMPEELLERIFIPFFSTKKSGNGIGLSLSKQIMVLHKGHIQVQSKEGEGSAFLLVF
jgi:two-component system nitrogen regulation sensor histidine kinase NtrY